MHHLSLILFLIAIDWLLKKTTDDCKRGIICPPPHLLENLDFADDLENLDIADDLENLDFADNLKNIHFADDIALLSAWQDHI